MSTSVHSRSWLERCFAESFCPYLLWHRRLIVSAIDTRMDKRITAQQVSAYYSQPGKLTDFEAIAIFVLKGFAVALEIESGREVTDDEFQEMRRLAYEINTPDMLTETLMDLILERMPGSLTHKPVQSHE